MQMSKKKNADILHLNHSITRSENRTTTNKLIRVARSVLSAKDSSVTLESKKLTYAK